MVFRATAAEQKLEQAGMEPKVARAVTETLEDMHGSLTSALVTKEYLDAQLKTLDANLRTTIGELRIAIGEVETRLLRWIVGIGGAILVAVLAALLRDILVR